MSCHTVAMHRYSNLATLSTMVHGMIRIEYISFTHDLSDRIILKPTKITLVAAV